MFFWVFLILHVFLLFFLIFVVSKVWFGASPCKAMQNHLDILSKSQFLITYFLQYLTFLPNLLFWPPGNIFWSTNRVLQVSGPDTLQNALKITSKSKFSTPIVQIPSHLHPALSYSLRGGSHKGIDSDLCSSKFFFRIDNQIFSVLVKFKKRFYKSVVGLRDASCFLHCKNGITVFFISRMFFLLEVSIRRMSVQ